QALHFLKLTEHYPFIEVQGIMTIAPLEFEKSEKKLRKFFKKTFHEYKEKILPHLSFASPQLSMGMSNDFTIAIEDLSNLADFKNELSYVKFVRLNIGVLYGSMAVN
ncbi:MAG: hypothetical protein ACTSP3_15230, partial [Candidatus Heimdallarchaeaceae archaeon]